MSLTSPATIAVLSALAFIIALYSVWQITLLNRMRKTFFADNKGADLESVILTLKGELTDSRIRQDVLEQSLAGLQHSATFALQKVGLVRFNPFNDGGGNFSFCLALLDAHNTGVVVTSMYGREQNRIYTKKIEGGKCDTKLTEEELQAINLADSMAKD